VQFNTNWNFFGLKNTWNSLGINHQSNGQSSDLSRSWNRVYGSFVFEYGDLGLTLTPWYRLPESAGDDDNPDITDYLGHYEVGATYKWDDHTFSLMTRNALESDFHRGSLQASWSFPLGDWPYLRGYVQYFNGYGESLIDYDQYVNRVGVGLSLSDWL
jgi:phospholipase A1